MQDLMKAERKRQQQKQQAVAPGVGRTALAWEPEILLLFWLGQIFPQVMFIEQQKFEKACSPEFECGWMQGETGRTFSLFLCCKEMLIEENGDQKYIQETAEMIAAPLGSSLSGWKQLGILQTQAGQVSVNLATQIYWKTLTYHFWLLRPSVMKWRLKIFRWSWVWCFEFPSTLWCFGILEIQLGRN